MNKRCKNDTSAGIPCNRQLVDRLYRYVANHPERRKGRVVLLEILQRKAFTDSQRFFSLQRADAEDVAQEYVLKVLASFKSYDGRPPSPYLDTILRHAVMDLRRSDTRRSKLHDDYPHTALARIKGQTETFPEGRLDKIRERANLSPEEDEVYRRDRDDQTSAEIAHAMKISVSRVYGLRHAYVQKLRNASKDE